jgi:hypothetical protein
MASEDASFSGADWQTYTVKPTFTLSAEFGEKTVYFKVKNGNGESEASSDDITFNKAPMVAVFQINGGAADTITRSVTLNNTAAGNPTHYMASEDPGFAGADWRIYNAAPPFMLSDGYGEKTIYLKVKNSYGESEMVSDDITYDRLPVVTLFAINNGASDTASQKVTLNNTATGSPTHYMASENAGFIGASWQTYSAGPSFTLGAGYGEKTVYFKVKNGNGESEAVSDGITFRELPAVTMFQINGGAVQTTSRTVTLNNAATGNPTQYMASEFANFADATWQSYSVAPSFALSEGNGKKTVYFKVRNGNGESDAVSDGITFRELPVVTAFRINNGASGTVSRTVTLNNLATGSPAEYLASESASFADAAWQPYNAAPSFILSEGSGEKTVYFKVRNGNVESAVVSDGITYKEIPAVTAFQINGGADKTTGRTVTLNNVAPGGPTEYMASEYANFADAAWRAYAVAPSFTLSVGDGKKTVYFKVKNGNGESAAVSDGITLRETPTVTTFAINPGAVETASRTVTLNNVATGSPTEYMASESASFAGAAWQVYTVAPSFTLSAGYGEKIVYLKVKNAYGESETVSDSITLSELPAVTAFRINNGADETASRTVTLNNTATGSSTHYMASESSTFANAAWKSYAEAPPFTLSVNEGEKTVYFKVKNTNGPSVVVSDTITLKKAQNVVVADAGIDQLARRGNVITLDGSRSFSAEGDAPLTYEWSIVLQPAGAGSLLSDPKSANPTFSMKRQGRYEIQLVVKDALGAASEPDTVIISTQDTAPVADAGSDQSIRDAGTRITLNGSQSYDPDGDALAYQWAFASKPAKSAASLEGAHTAGPSFVADVQGDYRIHLTVIDGQSHRVSDTVAVSFGNVRPVANAGKSRAVKVEDTVTLSGDGTDANGETLHYRWVLSSLPDGSLSKVSDAPARVTSFTPDCSGAYVAQLVVNDGELDSKPSAIQIQAYTVQTEAITALQKIAAGIAALDGSAFENSGMQNMLLNKLNAAIANEDAGKHTEAANQLRNDIMPKMGSVE